MGHFNGEMPICIGTAMRADGSLLEHNSHSAMHQWLMESVFGLGIERNHRKFTKRSLDKGKWFVRRVPSVRPFIRPLVRSFQFSNWSDIVNCGETGGEVWRERQVEQSRIAENEVLFSTATDIKFPADGVLIEPEPFTMPHSNNFACNNNPRRDKRMPP